MRLGGCCVSTCLEACGRQKVTDARTGVHHRGTLIVHAIAMLVFEMKTITIDATIDANN